MAKFELEPFQRVSAETLLQRTGDWLALPLYTDLPHEERERLEALTTGRSEKASVFLEAGQSEYETLLAEGREFDALRFLSARLKLSSDELSGDELASVQRRLLYLRGIKHGNIAIKGSYSSLPYSDPARRMMFLLGASDLMQADIVVGSASDYGFHVGDCFGGAALPGLQQQVFEKLLSRNSGVIIVGRGTPEHVEIEGMAQLGTIAKAFLGDVDTPIGTLRSLRAPRGENN